MLPFKKNPLAWVVSSFALVVAPAVFADATADKSDSDAKKENKALETVVVTATRRESTVEDIPFNISAIGEEELRQRSITDLKSLIADSVAISAPGNSARFADSVTVRGLNVSPVNQNNLEYFVRSTLAYYLDETPLPNIGYRIKDVARVETLLGPQGTLYGSGSLGGTVRYITNQPQFDESTVDLNSAVYQTSGGGLSTDTDVVINQPLGETVALRASLAYLDEAGFTDRVITPSFREDPWSNPNGSSKTRYKDDDYQRATTGKVALAWQLNADAKLTLTHAQQSQLANGSRGSTLDPNAEGDVFQYGRDVVVARYDEYSDRDFSLDSVDLDWDFGAVAVKSSTSYFEDTRAGQANYGIGFVYYGDWGWTDDLQPQNTVETPYMRFDNTYSGLSHETRFVSQGDGPLSWVGGLYYTHQERSQAFWEVFPSMDRVWGFDRTAIGGPQDTGYAENINTDYEEMALFGELTYALTERWNATLGARVFNYTDTADPHITDYAYGLVDTRGAVENSASGEHFFKFNTSYDLSDDVMVYATASQGFRRGGTNGFKDQGDLKVAESTQNYKPDSVDNFELGLKGDFFDDTLYLQADIYRIDWHDTQTYYDQNLNSFPLNGTANGPDSISQGLELSSRWAITDNFSLNYEAATTSAEWAETKEVCVYADGSECRTWSKGGQLGGAPEWRHNLGFSYFRTLDNGLALSAGLRGVYTSEVQSDRADSPDEQPALYDAYTLYHANVSLSADQWDATLWVRNLTDERVQVSYQSEYYVGGRVIETMPRTLGVNFSYRL